MTSLTDAPSLLPVLTTAVGAGDTAWLLSATALVLLMAPGCPVGTETVRREGST